MSQSGSASATKQVADAVERHRRMQVMADAPTHLAKAFICPLCQVKSAQFWFQPSSSLISSRVGPLYGPSPQLDTDRIQFCQCQTCHGISIWADDRIVHPANSSIPMPAADMPDDVKYDYLEARNIFNQSARGAGGLLRLAFGKLFPHIGVKAHDLDKAIAELVKQGFAAGELQQAMDSLRVFSNQAVHDGFVKLEDQPTTVEALFGLMNLVVEKCITSPNRTANFYKSLPADKIHGIEKRDKPKQ